MAAISEDDRCKRLGIASRRWHVIGRDYGIPDLWVQRYIQRKYQEDLDSSDAMVDSSIENTSMGDCQFSVSFNYLATFF